MVRFTLTLLVTALLIASCGKPLKSSTKDSTTTASTSSPSTGPSYAAWNQFEPELSVWDGSGTPLIGSGDKDVRPVTIGESYQLSMFSEMEVSGVKYEIVLFDGSSLIQGTKCSAEREAEFTGEVKACIAFKDPTPKPLPILITFTGPFGTKSKMIYFTVKAPPVPNLILGTVKQAVSTQTFAVDSQDRMSPTNSPGEFRIKATYDGKEIVDPQVLPSGTIARVGDEYVVSTPNAGFYTFKANWKDAVGTTAMEKRVAIGVEKRIQAGEPGAHGMSSTHNGGIVTCTSTKQSSITINSEEFSGDKSYSLDMNGLTSYSSPEIFRKGDSHELRYLHFRMMIPAEAADAECKLKVRGDNFTL